MQSLPFFPKPMYGQKTENVSNELSDFLVEDNTFFGSNKVSIFLFTWYVTYSQEEFLPQARNPELPIIMTNNWII